MQQVYDDFGFGTFPGTLRNTSGTRWGRLRRSTLRMLRGTDQEQRPADGSVDCRRVQDQQHRQRSHSQDEGLQVDHRQPDCDLDARLPGPSPIAQTPPALPTGRRTSTTSSPSRSRRRVPRESRGPAIPVTLPPNQSGNRIDGMGNPYTDAFPNADSNTPLGYRNQIGYRTYVQFMMDFGRDAAGFGPVRSALTVQSVLPLAHRKHRRRHVQLSPTASSRRTRPGAR